MLLPLDQIPPRPILLSLYAFALSLFFGLQVVGIFFDTKTLL